jgi:tyrosyl-tRNA synthetase
MGSMSDTRAPASQRPPFLAELEWRGLLQDESEGLAARLARGPIKAYVGFDPSSPSLQVGNLMPIQMLVHLQQTGAGTPTAVAGGGTGMIGDPSGKSAERNLLDDETLTRNTANIRAQLERFLDFSGSGGAKVYDNRDWLTKWSLIDWLRDRGKYFSVSYMLAKDSVQSRLAAGISFTEFSYMTLQATDFLHLYQTEGVELQMGGADQWGNITAGTELIRRVEGLNEDGSSKAFAAACPLLLTSTGTKFGKTEAGAVWLDATMTSPYAFYQYWVGQDDRDVAMMLRRLTMLSADAIFELEEQQQAHPEARPGQKLLAFEMTKRVHGEDEALKQQRVAEAAFSGEPIRDPEVLEVLYREIDNFDFYPPQIADWTALDLVVEAGLVGSKSEGRRLIEQGGLRINGDRVVDIAEGLPALIADRYLEVRVGKRKLLIARSRA